jgi:diaminopimelate epimerase
VQVHYLKMQGAGNKILVVDTRHNPAPPPGPARLRELADATTGPGFDQLMWVNEANDAANAARYRVFNADGSEVEQCGNGVRCVARMLAQETEHPTSFSLESPAGLVSARIRKDGLVSVSMGSPDFDPACIPFLAEERAASYTLEVDGQEFEIQAVSMGNPHCVLPVRDVETAPVNDLGPRIEHHERFPERSNVGFMSIVDRENIDLRVHERGVGETLACGTGAAAAVVCGQQLGLLDPEVSVRLPGGELVVSWRGGAEPVWLTGDAELISEGTLDL